MEISPSCSTDLNDGSAQAAPFEMPGGIRLSFSSPEKLTADLSRLRAEWARLQIEAQVLCREQTQPGGVSLYLQLADKAAQEWMPGLDTLGLGALLKLQSDRIEDDLLREIWLTLLNCPLSLEFPDAAELFSAVRIRGNIVRNAARTCLNFHTSAIERPADCWRYSEETGFVLIPGSPLIDSLKKACQPEAGGQLYSFSCYRATEYVILLSVAEEARESHPELLQQLQAQWETKAISSGLFHEVFMLELGTLEQPLPIHYYVPGDRVWFRNPDAASSEVAGYEGSWVFYLGGGQFSNFWKSDKPFNLRSKAIEIHHWRDSTVLDDQGELQMDEIKVEQLVAQTLADPVAFERIFERMHRLRDAQGVYDQGGCMDATREAPRFVRAPHSDILQALTTLVS